MLIDFFIIIAGIASILFLAQVVVNNAVELARYLGLSESLIGLTVLSIGTSIPEIMSHIVGSSEILRHPEMINLLSGMLIGTNIGSDIFQQNFILPFIGLVGTVTVLRAQVHDVMGGLLGAAILAWLFCLGGVVSRLEGFILVLAYIGYLLFLIKRDKPPVNHPERESMNNRTAWLPAAIIVVSFTIMAVVTEQVVLASIDLIKQLPISASFFGVVFLGVVTSLPEFTTALVSMYKGKRDISVGVLLGSNVTNPLLGIGLGALLSTYTVPNVIILYDLPVNIVTTVLLYGFLIRHKDLSRAEAIILFAFFFTYLYVRLILFPADFPELGR